MSDANARPWNRRWAVWSLLGAYVVLGWVFGPLAVCVGFFTHSSWPLWFHIESEMGWFALLFAPIPLVLWAVVMLAVPKLRRCYGADNLAIFIGIVLLIGLATLAPFGLRG